MLVSPSGAAGAGETIVALGDSYSSGEGNRPWDQGTNVKRKNMCHRSEYGWPRLIGTPRERHIACSGARIEHLGTGQWPGSPPDDVGQIAQLAAIASQTPIDIVTISMGGNDLEFASIVALCVLKSDCGGKLNPLTGSRLDTVLGALEMQLRTSYRAIQGASRGARLVVVGYPRIFPREKSKDRCWWLSTKEKRRGEELATKLEATIKRAAESEGATFASTLNALDGHELCTEDSWMYPIASASTTFGLTGDPRQAHPTKPGQLAMAVRVRRAIESAPPNCVPASSLAAIVDDSGSMSSNDPQLIRRRALELLLSKPSALGRTVGAVEFGGGAGTLFAPAFVGAKQAEMISALTALQNDGSGQDDDGETNYNAAFERSATEQPSPGARIFLTDGGHNVDDYADGHRGGPPTYVVGLNIGPAGQGNDDGDRLDRIARETGGRYFPLRRLDDDDASAQLARLQPVVNEIDALLSCVRIHDEASVPFARVGEYGKPVRTSFEGESALEAVVSWADNGVDIDLAAASVRDARGRVIADLKGKRRIAGSKRRRARLAVSVVEGQTFDTVTVQRPKRGRTLVLRFRAAALPMPVTAEVQIRPVAGGRAPEGTMQVPAGSSPTQTSPPATTTNPPATSAPPSPPPKPTASNLVVVVYGGGHVGVAFDVGWQEGRDPVTCHFFRDGVEVFTAQCGTRSSKQFYGVPPGRHSFYATVSDRFGVYSDPTNTVVKDTT